MLDEHCSWVLSILLIVFTFIIRGTITVMRKTRSTRSFAGLSISYCDQMESSSYFYSLMQFGGDSMLFVCSVSFCFV